MRLILFGPPGSGKGTQGRLLAKHFNVPHIATGELMREEIAQKTPFGLEIQGTIAKGQLIADETALQLLTSRTAQLAHGYVLDGFPRTVHQAQLLLDISELGPITAAVYYDLEDSVAVTRLSGRLTCPTCDRSYHVDTEKPRSAGVCDDDGTVLVRRPEDTAEAIVTRLNVFHKQTEPLLSYFECLGLLAKVNALGDPTEIFARTLSLLVEKDN
jgi:adenylate kinase